MIYILYFRYFPILNSLGVTSISSPGILLLSTISLCTFVVLDTIKVIYIHLLNAVKIWRVGYGRNIQSTMSIFFFGIYKRGFQHTQELDTLQTRYPLWSGFPYYNVTTSLGKAPQSDTWERTQQLYGFQPCMRTFTGTQFMTKKHTYTFVGTLLQKLYSFILVPTHSCVLAYNQNKTRRGLSV